MPQHDEQTLTQLIERLKFARLNTPGMTQAKAANISGLSVETIKSIELARAKPSMLSIIALARAYGMLDQIEALFPKTLSPLVELEKMEKNKPRRRASREKKSQANTLGARQFVWGEDK